MCFFLWNKKKFIRDFYTQFHFFIKEAKDEDWMINVHKTQPTNQPIAAQHFGEQECWCRLPENIKASPSPITPAQTHFN